LFQGKDKAAEGLGWRDLKASALGIFGRKARGAGRHSGKKLGALSFKVSRPEGFCKKRAQAPVLRGKSLMGGELEALWLWWKTARED